ncbi:MAG: PDDEXK nuclease domain-containing protein [Phycisphaerae bacterium]|nr:PDDEXK nuclease domain-containing protein [Phycisphaerae bacterium]
MSKPRRESKPQKRATIVRRVAGLSPSLLGDIRSLIEATRGRVAQTVNSELVLLYWQIGTRIRQDILHEKRAEYGEQILHALSAKLVAEYGPGFSEKVLRHITHFAEVYPDERSVSALRRQLSWTHLREIIYLPDPLQRDFYAEMCRVERWSTRTLHAKIQGLLYERTAISRKPAQLARQELAALRDEDRMTPDLVFRDPYVLDFLGLADTYSEKDLEAGILRELERFLLELGAGFSFVARQKRIAVDGEDYYLDLLFYHRRLRRLVAIDLKLGRFQAADKGQMELYLRWLDEHDRQPGEEAPIGLILCTGKSAEHVKLLRLEQSHIRVAEYLTELPPREVLERKLIQAIQVTRQRLRGGND